MFLPAYSEIQMSIQELAAAVPDALEGVRDIQTEWADVMQELWDKSDMEIWAGTKQDTRRQVNPTLDSVHTLLTKNYYNSAINSNNDEIIRIS